MEKALKKFMKDFKLEYTLPNWKHRGHTVFPTGEVHDVPYGPKFLRIKYFTASPDFVQKKQVCLMSQSWDNVASMHDHLLIVHANKTET